MTCQYRYGLSSRDIPETDGIIATPRTRQGPTIRRKHNSTDLIGMAHKGGFEMPSGSVPQTDSAVIASASAM